MAVVLGLSIGVAYGAPAAAARAYQRRAPHGGRAHGRRARLLFMLLQPAWQAPHAPGHTQPAHLAPAGLAGYVDYPTQELVSGLLPLDQMDLLGNYTGTDCIKPGMGLPGYNATNKIPGGLVRQGGRSDQGTWRNEGQTIKQHAHAAIEARRRQADRAAACLRTPAPRSATATAARTR